MAAKRPADDTAKAAPADVAQGPAPLRGDQPWAGDPVELPAAKRATAKPAATDPEPTD
jgi:hypothetical protein